MSDANTAAAELAEARAALARVEEMAQVGSWAFDLRTGKLTWSEQLFRIHGFEPGAFEPTAETASKLVHPDDAGLLIRTHARVGETRQVPFMYRVVRPSSEVRFVSARIMLVRDEAGLPLRLVGAVHDVTERHRLEDLLAQSQRMEAVGRLAGGVAHDFNNLLATIVLNASMGRRQAAGNTRLESSLSEIEAAASRAGDLTRQLLAFARRQPIAPRVFAPGEVTRGIAALLDRMVSKQVTLRVEAAPDLWRVKADPTQFEQVIVNLVVNARDAMPDGGAIDIRLRNVTLDDVDVQRHPDARPGPHVVLEVCDSGVGISPEVLPHVFDPFFTTKRPGEGTGLGLATVHGIVSQAEGHVTVESTPGQGATFRVYLPRTAESVGGEHGMPRGLRGGDGRELIMLVDDEEQVRRATAQVLEGLGYSVIVAGSGPEALSYSETPTPLAILVTDVVMKGMSGIELARELRKRRPGLRVLLISGYAPSEVARGSTFPLLSKPFSPTQLAQRIREILDAEPVV